MESEDILIKLKSNLNQLIDGTCSDYQEILEEIRYLINAADRSQLLNLFQEIDFKLILSNIKEIKSNEVKINAIEILGKFLDLLPKEYIITNLTDDMKIALNSNSPELIIIWLKVLINCINDLSANHNILTNSIYINNEQSPLLNVIDLLKSENGDVNKYSNILLINFAKLTSKNSSTVHILFTNLFDTKFKQIKQHNDIIKLRVYQLMIDISLISPLMQDKVNDNGYLNDIIDEIKSDDILFSLNCIQLLITLSTSKYGIDFLESNGSLNLLSQQFQNNEDIFNSLKFIPLMRLFGTIGQVNPVLIGNKFKNVINKIFDSIDNQNESIKLCSIETVGAIGASLDGKKLLDSFKERFVNECLSKFNRNIISGNDEIKVRTLSTLSQLFIVSESDKDGEGTTIIENWFNKLDKNTSTQIITLCKQPFMDIKLTAYNLLRSLLTHLWGQKIFSNIDDFIDFLLDRSTEYDKLGKESKYDTIKELVNSPFISFTFTREQLFKLKKYLKEGPFYIAVESTVAVEAGH